MSAVTITQMCDAVKHSGYIGAKIAQTLQDQRDEILKLRAKVEEWEEWHRHTPDRIAQNLIMQDQVDNSEST